LQTLKHYHEIAPPDVAFFLVGGSTPTFVHNVRRVCGDRELFFLSSKLFYLASKGTALLPSGNKVHSPLPKLELLQENYKTYQNMVNRYAY